MSRNYLEWLIGLLAVAAAAAALFGFAGFRTIIGIAALLVMPALLLLKNFGLDTEEKIFFSLFIGIGLFPLLVFAINRVLPSFRASMAAALAVAALAGIVAPMLQKMRKN